MPALITPFTYDQKAVDEEKLRLHDLVIIVNVFVHPATMDRQRVYLNNYKAMRHAIRKALEGRPDMDELIENKELSRHPLRYSP